MVAPHTAQRLATAAGPDVVGPPRGATFTDVTQLRDIVVPYEATHRFTVGEYLRAHERGVIPESKRTELIAGQVVDMSPASAPHAAAVGIVRDYCYEASGTRGQLRTENTLVIKFSQSVPQPDVAYCVIARITTPSPYPHTRMSFSSSRWRSTAWSTTAA